MGKYVSNVVWVVMVIKGLERDWELDRFITRQQLSAIECQLKLKLVSFRQFFYLKG